MEETVWRARCIVQSIQARKTGVAEYCFHKIQGGRIFCNWIVVGTKYNYYDKTLGISLWKTRQDCQDIRHTMVCAQRWFAQSIPVHVQYHARKDAWRIDTLRISLWKTRQNIRWYVHRDGMRNFMHEPMENSTGHIYVGLCAKTVCATLCTSL